MNPTVTAATLAVALLVLASCGVRPWRSERAATVAAPAGPSPTAQPQQPERIFDFTATAYSVDGTTASGRETREGMIAADPDVLPLGSRVRVSGAGRYSGVYVVRDTGKKIRGREIDIFLENDREAKHFGRKRVKVELLNRSQSAPGSIPASSSL